MIKIVLEKTKFHRFALYYTYSQERVNFCRQLKESFGWDSFSFASDGNLKRWVFSNSIFIPVLAEKFPEIEINSDVIEIVNYEQKWANERRKQDDKIDNIRSKKKTNFYVKGLKKKIYDYQNIGVEFLIASGGRAIIADSPGLGKSVQALGYIKHMDFKRILIVCPASVKFAWRNEISKWTNMSSIIIDSKTNISNIASKIQIWLINYDILRKHYNQLSKIRFDCLIGDESQFIKNPKAIRTKAFRELSRQIQSIVMLSGTPLLSRPAELYSLLNIIDNKTWNDWYMFARRYCALKQTRWGVDTSGASNIGELHDKIKRYFIRRDKTQVLKELPPKTFIDVPIQISGDSQRDYEIVAGDLATYLRKNMGMKSPEVAKSMSAEKLVQLNILRQLCSMGKVETAKELIESIIDSGEKVLVFSSFVQPLETLHAMFKKESVIITGKTSVEDRGDIVKEFQENNNIKVFFGGFRSAGTGITLTAAQNFIGIDLPWNPADLQQATDRLHRPGQTATNVNIYQLFAIDTVDEDMRDILNTKQDIFDQVIDGKVANKKATEAMESAVQRVLKNY